MELLDIFECQYMKLSKRLKFFVILSNVMIYI